MIKTIKNIEKFEKFQFKHYSTKNLDNDSPMKSAITFLVNFINNLDENSPFIYPLILINSGNYVYGKEDAYGYGLTNIELLKSYLQNIIPDIIITISDEEKISEKAISKKILRSLKLNLESQSLSLFKFYKFDKKIENKDISSNLELLYSFFNWTSKLRK